MIAQYDPNGLLDEVSDMLNVKNDAALSRALGVTPAIISKARHHVQRIGPSLLVKCHEAAGISFPAIRAYVPAVVA